ncbi:MAG: methylated-DNA--[protein]-cysteine S-methyltransferase [Acidobacteria bacterium]|nr:methylated-DNA--[protein]-cysteine S-methyltransferase [Acidobacteriota bacterium]
MTTLPTKQEMRRAFLSGDATYDGVFFTGVKTTGIFCRPSCTARKPRPENVEFFATPREAAFSGYRPCKRCRPLDTDGRPPAWVGRLLARVDADPASRIRAAELRAEGIDPARARRYFLKHFGMTFQAYGRAKRLADAFHQIKGGATVSDAASDGGFESESGFRSAFARAFGTSPGEAHDGDTVSLDWIASPVGPLIAGATTAGVCLLEFTDRRMLEAQLSTLGRRLGMPLIPGRNRWLERLRVQLGEYFDGAREAFDLPLVIRGTVFQERVWNALLTIPYGETWSYRDLARCIGNPAATRAVGTANGMNRIAIVIPCHRVVNADGRLGGYGGGVWRKRSLLDLERGQDSITTSVASGYRGDLAESQRGPSTQSQPKSTRTAPPIAEP